MTHQKNASLFAGSSPAERRPNGGDGNLQMDPTTHGCLYTIVLHHPFDEPLDSVQIFAVGPTAVGSEPAVIYDAMTEYWQVRPGLRVDAASSIEILASEQATPTAPATFPETGTTPYCMPTSPGWISAAALPPSEPGMFFWSDGDASTGTITRAAALDLSKIEEGRVRWYQWSADDDQSPYVVSPSTMVNGRMVWSAERPAIQAGGACWTVDLAGQPPPPQPVHCWLFSQTASPPDSDVALDSVGQAPGALLDGAKFPRDLGNGLVEIGGDTSRVTFVPDVLASETRPFTVALWVRPVWDEALLGESSLFAIPGPPTSAGMRIHLHHELGSPMRVSVSLGPITLSVPLAPGEFQHLAVTRSRDGAGSQTLILYVNGVARAAQRGPAVDLGSASAHLGYSPETPHMPAAKGMIGDLRIYTQALSEQEVAQIATRYLPP